MPRPRGRPPKNPITEKIRTSAQEVGLPEGLATALVGAIALNTADAPKRYSEKQLADRYGVPFERLKALKNKTMAIMPEIRENMIVQNLAIANMATDLVVERLQDPDEVAQIKTTDMSRIATAHHGIARDLTGTAPKVDPNMPTPREIEVLRQLSAQVDAMPSLAERMKLADAHEVEPEEDVFQ